MTKSLELAIQQLQQLTEERQELLAGLLLHEIEQDRKWTKSTDSSAAKLRGLVDDILSADERGECDPLDPDEL